MSSKKISVVDKHKLVNFPEEVDEKNHIKVSGKTSYENQIAILSHYLHNSGEKLSKKRKEEIVGAIREYLKRKQTCHKLNIERMTDDELLMFAESSAQYLQSIRF